MIGFPVILMISNLMDSKSPERYISQALTVSVSKPCFAPGSRRHSSLNFCSLAATSWPGDRAKGHLSDGTRGFII